MTGIPSADRHRPALAIHDVVAGAGGPHRICQIRQLPGEHLLNRPMRREQAGAHQQRLHAPFDEGAVELPVVVRLAVLSDGRRHHDERERGHEHR